MSDAIERLSNMLIVCDEPEDVSHNQYKEYFQTMSNCKQEVVRYISSLMGSDQYYFKLYMPSVNAECTQITPNKTDECLELIYLPFGVFSLNVWGKIRNTDNPVYKLLKCLDYDTRAIRTWLSAKGVPDDTNITTKLLNEYNILDVFSLHSFEKVYSDAAKYFEDIAEIVA